MIKLNKPNKPQILIDNEINWKSEVDNLIKEYGNFKSIPSDKKENLCRYYRNDEIKCPLFKSSNYKCAYCECTPEESSNIQVEHFNPKSIYPHEMFDWDNLLPSCSRCNESKFTHDTKVNPLVNPYKEEPADFFEFDFLSIVPKNTGMIKAQNTIDACGLNDHRLIVPRSVLLVSLTDFIEELKNHLKQIKEADTELKTTRRIKKMRNSLDKIEELGKNYSKYSAFVVDFLKKSKIYQEAKKMIKLSGIKK